MDTYLELLLHLNFGDQRKIGRSRTSLAREPPEYNVILYRVLLTHIDIFLDMIELCVFNFQPLLVSNLIIRHDSGFKLNTVTRGEISQTCLAHFGL